MKGNAEFIVSIDGTQITTPQAVTALHSAGKWNVVPITGNFGAGINTIGVTFINGGTANLTVTTPQ